MRDDALAQHRKYRIFPDHDARTNAALRIVPRRPGRPPHGLLAVGRRRRRRTSWCACTACRARAATSTCWRRPWWRARAAAARGLPRRGGPRPQRLAEGPDGLPDADLRGRHAGAAGAAARAGADRHARLGRHQHGRADRHGASRARRSCRCRRRCAGWCSTTSGPVIQWQALQRIGTYLGKTGRFESVQQAADAMWAISTSFGPHTPEQWLALSRHMVQARCRQGGFTLHYDPAIAVPFRALDREPRAAGRGGALAAVRRHPGADAAACAAPSPTCCRATPRRP